MKRVQQRGDVDCAVACVAMVLDWTYDQVTACMDDNGIELDPFEGVSPQKLLQACGYEGTCSEGFYIPDDKPVILILPSNNAEFNHGVVCFDAKLFDPSADLSRRRFIRQAIRVARFTIYDIKVAS